MSSDSSASQQFHPLPAFAVPVQFGSVGVVGAVALCFTLVKFEAVIAGSPNCAEYFPRSASASGSSYASTIAMFFDPSFETAVLGSDTGLHPGVHATRP